MRSMMCFAVASTVTLSFSLSSSAGQIVNHASALVRISTDAPGGGLSIVHGYDQAIIGPVSGSFANYASLGKFIDSSAYVSVNPVSSRLMSLYASASTNTGGGYTPRAQAISSGAWRDVIYLESNVQPAQIQLHFSFSGSLSLNYDPDNSYSGGYVGFRPEVHNGILPDTILAEGWSQSNLIESSTSLTVNIPYDAGYQGYSWTLLAAAQTVMSGFASGEVDFSHTVALSSVTLLDGTEISNDQMRFDSGLQIVPASAVPEPSTIILAGLGLLLGVTVSRRAGGWRW